MYARGNEYRIPRIAHEASHTDFVCMTIKHAMKAKARLAKIES
jgi:hypothetical protein